MRTVVKSDNPNRQHVTLSGAFDYFNRRLFGGELRTVLITLQRKARMRGYYWREKFGGRLDPERRVDEIALNPATFEERSDTDILSTLVHEMVHLWQCPFGAPSGGNYHNRQWSEKMESLGLMPSETGLPGGARTGRPMSHYVLEGGAFDEACARLLAGGVRVEWNSRKGKERGTNSKTKFTCPRCGCNAWGCPNLRLICGDCQQAMPCLPPAGKP